MLPKIGVFTPQNGWFISWKTLLKLMIWGGFTTPIFGNTHMVDQPIIWFWWPWWRQFQPICGGRSWLCFSLSQEIVILRPFWNLRHHPSYLMVNCCFSSPVKPRNGMKLCKFAGEKSQQMMHPSALITKPVDPVACFRIEINHESHLFPSPHINGWIFQFTCYLCTNTSELARVSNITNDPWSIQLILPITNEPNIKIQLIWITHF